MKKNMMTKIMAIVALLGIILWVVSTWALILYETLYAPQTVKQENIASEKLDLSKLLENSWAIYDSWTTISTWITK